MTREELLVAAARAAVYPRWCGKYLGYGPWPDIDQYGEGADLLHSHPDWAEYG